MSSRTDFASRRGFTLIELLVVIAIIATLASIVGPEVLRHTGTARTQAARSQVEMLTLALDAYRLDNGAPPPTEPGLALLRTAPLDGEAARTWRGPYLRRIVPDDPWGVAYVYAAPGRNGAEYDLYTLGRDGRPGGVGEDADVTSSGDPVMP